MIKSPKFIISIFCGNNTDIVGTNETIDRMKFVEPLLYCTILLNCGSENVLTNSCVISFDQ